MSVYKAPHFLPTVVRPDVSELWDFIEMQLIYGFVYGLKKNAHDYDEKKQKVDRMFKSIKTRINLEKLIQPIGIYQYFKAKAQDDTITVFSSDLEPLTTFTFPREKKEPFRCLADWVARDEMDTIGLLVTTCGHGLKGVLGDWLSHGEYQEVHALGQLAGHLAEGFAEYQHQKIRAEWGIPDASNTTLKQLYNKEYQGIRVSFGYSMCPQIEDQAKIWTLLKPDQQIGVALTDGFMMNPEASVSAIMLAHPKAEYFEP